MFIQLCQSAKYPYKCHQQETDVKELQSAEELFLLILIVIDLPFGPIDFLPNYFFSAQLKLRAAAYNHLQYKQLLLVAKVFAYSSNLMPLWYCET